MSKRFLCALVLVFFAFGLAAAQQPMRQKTAPMAKPRPRSAVTVIDLRNVANEKKPPKRAPEATYSTRMMHGQGSNAAVAALAPMQLSEALRGAGISVTPPNVYARFTPGQTRIPGKGYMYLASADWAFPDHVEFHDFHLDYEGVAPENGPMVVLREPGTYALDFLVEFTHAPVGTPYGCDVLVGSGILQVQALEKTGGPQHIVVIWSLDPAMLGLQDEQRSVGIHCYMTGRSARIVPWTLYLVDVTKL